MQPVRPTLAQALLTGSLQHFLAALFIPVLLIGIGVCLRLARLAGGFPVAEILAGVAFVTAVYAVVLGTIFLFHEVVLLIAVVIERRRRRVAAVTTDVANDLLMAVVATDIVAEMLLFALLAWQGEDMRDVLYFFLLPIVGFYGVYLFGCRVREALAPPPAPPGSIVAAEASRGTPALCRRRPFLLLAPSWPPRRCRPRLFLRPRSWRRSRCRAPAPHRQGVACLGCKCMRREPRPGWAGVLSARLKVGSLHSALRFSASSSDARWRGPQSSGSRRDKKAAAFERARAGRRSLRDHLGAEVI